MVSRHRLERWKKAGIIDAGQVDRILAFEADARSSSHWLVWSIAAVGGIAIAAGIISVIAAHWDVIPDWFKLVLGVGLLASLPLAALRWGERAGGWPRDLLLLIHQLLVVGVIGLVGQVFHLHGAPWRVFALATALAVPAAIAAKRQLHVDVVIGYALALLGFGLAQVDVWDELWDDDCAGFSVMAAIGVVFYSVSHLVREHFIAAPLKRWGLGMLFFALVGQSVRWGLLESLEVNHPTAAAAAMAVALGVALAVVRKPSTAWVAFAAMCIITLLGPDIWFNERSFGAQLVGFVLCGLLCLSWSFLAAERGVRWSVNLATFALAVRIVIAFFDLFGSLMDTGIALLATGVVLIAVAFGWWRLRAAIPIRTRVEVPS